MVPEEIEIAIEERLKRNHKPKRKNDRFLTYLERWMEMFSKK